MLKEVLTKAACEADVKPRRVLREALWHAERWRATSTKASPGRSCGV
jgi:hypothetical protein